MGSPARPMGQIPQNPRLHTDQTGIVLRLSSIPVKTTSGTQIGIRIGQAGDHSLQSRVMIRTQRVRSELALRPPVAWSVRHVIRILMTGHGMEILAHTSRPHRIRGLTVDKVIDRLQRHISGRKRVMRQRDIPAARNATAISLLDIILPFRSQHESLGRPCAWLRQSCLP